MEVVMRVAIAVLSVLCCAMGCAARHRIPEWATPKPGTTYDAKAGLPKEVMDRETGIALMLVPTGELRAGTPDGTETWKNMRTFYLSKDPVPAAVWGKYMGPDAPYPAFPFDVEVGQSYFAVIMAFDGDQEFFARTGFRAPTLSEVEYGDAYWASSPGADERRLVKPPGFFSLRVARDP